MAAAVTVAEWFTMPSTWVLLVALAVPFAVGAALERGDRLRADRERRIRERRARMAARQGGAGRRRR
jgi:hypothetical protein